jgi:RNA polymerase sigma factor (sigma-70 family)
VRRERGSHHGRSRSRVFALTSERSILARVAAGEPGAANECIEHFRGLVWSLARRLCPSPSEAEDAVQEIFIDLWRSAARFDASIASEATFVATIARRRLIDRARRRKRRPEQAMISETVAAPVDDNDQTEVSEVAEIAHRAFERLRPEQKRVLHLSIRQGQSHEQIATTTGLPLGTVKTHARRGLIRLRELLAAEGLPVDELTAPQRPARAKDDEDGDEGPG